MPRKDDPWSLTPPQAAARQRGPYDSAGNLVGPRRSKAERLAIVYRRALAAMPHPNPSRWKSKEKK